MDSDRSLTDAERSLKAVKRLLTDAAKSLLYRKLGRSQVIEIRRNNVAGVDVEMKYL